MLDIERCSICGEIHDLTWVEGRDGLVMQVCPECRKTYFVTCEKCGDENNFIDNITEIDGENWCRCCVKESFYKCDDCGELVHRDDAYETVDGGHICERCRDYDYVYCDCCQRYERAEFDGVFVDGDYYCENCKDEHLVCCDDCGEWFRKDDCRRTENCRWICDSCYEEGYITCEDCGAVVSYDDSECVNDCYYCSDCATNHRTPDGVYGYHEYHCGYTKHKCEGETTDMYFGVELECDDGSFDYDPFEYHSDLLHFERDGSLSEDGVELITMPCSLRYHQEEYPWKGVCEKLLRQGFRSHDTDNCGLHVHISRHAILPTTIAKMDVFINRSGESFWSKLSRRSRFYDERYDDNRAVNKSRPFYMDSGRIPHKMSESIERYCTCASNRYTAVNVTNARTVEIRTFKGTLKWETVIGTIELCHAVVSWLNTVPITRIYDMKSLIPEFIMFVVNNAVCYPNLIPMMRERLRNTEWKAWADMPTKQERIEINKNKKESVKCA